MRIYQHSLIHKGMNQAPSHRGCDGTAPHRALLTLLHARCPSIAPPGASVLTRRLACVPFLLLTAAETVWGVCCSVSVLLLVSSRGGVGWLPTHAISAAHGQQNRRSGGASPHQFCSSQAAKTALRRELLPCAGSAACRQKNRHGGLSPCTDSALPGQQNQCGGGGLPPHTNSAASEVILFPS